VSSGTPAGGGTGPWSGGGGVRSVVGMTSHTGGGNAAYGKGGSARLSRRRVLGGPAAASGGAALAVGTGAGTARAHGGVRTYVLVHGTHSAGFFWTAIGREPALRGHRVVMVDQPLHGTEKFVPKAYQAQDLRALATEPSPVAALTLDDFERRVTGAVRRPRGSAGPWCWSGTAWAASRSAGSPTRCLDSWPTSATWPRSARAAACPRSTTAPTPRKGGRRSHRSTNSSAIRRSWACCVSTGVPPTGVTSRCSGR